ncbi:MAG: 4'-phosphopantetheinyl transferase superfamily protein [Cyclobacteriaceae bacterium]|nr:4'-phosphopantetheinyl transferase superfamily protein [Cyclobacteriaceae bacterium]
MPLLKIHKDAAQSGWALWFITETEQELYEISKQPIDATITSNFKRIEWFAGRALLKGLVEQCGMNFYGVEKNEFGKPSLVNHSHHISLSHSFPYVAAQIDVHTEVGIDLEQPKLKLLNIAPRILNSIELADAGQDVAKHCVYWCAKEVLYKSFGKRGLHFAEHLAISPFTMQQTGEIIAKITFRDFYRTLSLQYSVQPDYVLVRTLIKN